MPYKILEHTADVRLAVTGKDLPELFESALLGMMAIIKPQKASANGPVAREIQLRAQDTTALLIDFLSDCLLALQTHKEGYEEITFKKLTETEIDAVLAGFKAESFEEDIKAVTYHEAEVKKNARGEWETTVVFDI